MCCRTCFYRRYRREKKRGHIIYSHVRAKGEKEEEKGRKREREGKIGTKKRKGKGKEGKREK